MIPPGKKTVNVALRRGQQEAASLSTRLKLCVQFLEETGGFWVSPDGFDIRPAHAWKEGYVGVHSEASA